MALERGSPEPLYTQLAAVIRERCHSGEYRARQKIPSVQKLMAEFDVADVTVRNAISLLVREGVLETVAGLGTFVCEELPRR